MWRPAERCILFRLLDAIHAVRFATSLPLQPGIDTGARVRGAIAEAPRSRLTIDLSDQQHHNLEALAASQGKTITQFALERLFPGDVEADQAWRELQTLLGRRIVEGWAGQISA